MHLGRCMATARAPKALRPSDAPRPKALRPSDRAGEENYVSTHPKTMLRAPGPRRNRSGPKPRRNTPPGSGAMEGGLHTELSDCNLLPSPPVRAC